MRRLSLFIAVALSGAAPFAIPATADEPSITAAPTADDLQAILARGSDRRTEIGELQADVARARDAYPNSPIFDYALGLICLKRLQHDKARDSFVAAARRDPTYLPARQALLRLELTQKDTQLLLVEVVALAGDIASSDVGWRDERHRSEAAALLGRVLGYLELPDTKLVDSTMLEATRREIEQKLYPYFVELLSDGMTGFTAEYCALLASNQQRAEEAAERHTSTMGASLERLQKRSAEAGRATETLNLSKQELNTQLDKEMKDVDRQLKKLKDDHATVLNSANKVDGMIRQTRVDIARLETELELRGFRGRELRLQPPLIQLQQELSKHQRTYADLDDKAGELAKSIRQAEAARDQVVARQQREKQQAIRKIDAAEKWKQVLSRKSQAVKRKAKTVPPRTAVRCQPVTVQQLFPFDFKVESARLLAEYRIEPSTDPQPMAKN